MGQLQQHSQFGLENHGLNNEASVHWNLGPEALYEATIREGSGVVSQGGSLVVKTGAYTGRSSNDKFIIEEETSRDNIWWGAVNKGNSE
ncbi:MAG: phosphoenolpyruvate carboxykinase (ATP), partial [Pseudomonadales bacterium]|nr:phosphoenolpyruvate carboxykinase (ATP) [Pseudomonadales bacterium]